MVGEVSLTNDMGKVTKGGRLSFERGICLGGVIREVGSELKEGFDHEVPDIGVIEEEISRMERGWVVESVGLLPCDPGIGRIALLRDINLGRVFQHPLWSRVHILLEAAWSIPDGGTSLAPIQNA